MVRLDRRCSPRRGKVSGTSIGFWCLAGHGGGGGGVFYHAPDLEMAWRCWIVSKTQRKYPNTTIYHSDVEWDTWDELECSISHGQPLILKYHLLARYSLYLVPSRVLPSTYLRTSVTPRLDQAHYPHAKIHGQFRHTCQNCPYRYYDPISGLGLSSSKDIIILQLQMTTGHPKKICEILSPTALPFVARVPGNFIQRHGAEEV